MKFKVTGDSSKSAVIDYVNRLSDGKQYDVVITQIKKKRSLSQNALYHMWLNCVAKETGNDMEGIADEFKRMFLGYRVVEVFGNEIEVLKTTTTLSTQEFTDYMDKIQMFCEIELGIILPRPEDKYYELFIDQYD